MRLPPFKTGFAFLGSALGLALFLTASSLLGSDVTAPAPTTGSGFSLLLFLAPFHMVVLHLPIGFISMVTALELWTWWKPSAERRAVIQFGLLLAVGATAATMILGYLRASGGGYDELTLGRHRGWGIAAGSLILISWGLHWVTLRHPAPGGLIAFRTLLFTGFLCFSVAGHHGGSLTHGSAFLTENAPAAVRGFLGMTPDFAGVTTQAGSTGGYEDVRASLEKKCFICHGPEKQKGKLRLDERALALQGGASGKPAITPGDPGRSEIIRASLLPKNHDESMPPEGKEPLTEVELAALIRWIQEGARY